MKYYILFWMISILGWIMEVFVCSLTEKRFVNRGFLLGPYCPIYGVGGFTMLLAMPYREDILVCFVMCFLIGGLVEYLSSYLLEAIFKVRWWDYSNDHFNLNGRICLRNCIAFGVLGVLANNYLFPLCFNLLNLLNSRLLLIVFIITFTITIIDIITSFNIMNKIKKSISNNLLDFAGDATNDIKTLINKTINKGRSRLQKRIINTYRDYTIERDKIINKVRTRVHKERFNNYTIIGLGLSIIIGFITKEYLLSLFIFILIGFIIDKLVGSKK